MTEWIKAHPDLAEVFGSIVVFGEVVRGLIEEAKAQGAAIIGIFHGKAARACLRPRNRRHRLYTGADLQQWSE